MSAFSLTHLSELVTQSLQVLLNLLKYQELQKLLRINLNKADENIQGGMEFAVFSS